MFRQRGLEGEAIPSFSHGMGEEEEGSGQPGGRTDEGAEGGVWAEQGAGIRPQLGSEDRHYLRKRKLDMDEAFDAASQDD